MRRRSFVASVALAASGVAGCARPAESEDPPTPPEIHQQTPTSRLVPSLPVEEIKSVAEAGVEAAPESVADLEAFEAALDEGGVDVVEVTEHEEFVSLTHAVDSFADEGVAHSLGVVAGVYAAFVAEHDDPGPLDVAVEHDGSEMGEYAVAPTWAEEYRSGATTAKEYAEKVLGTVKTKG